MKRSLLGALVLPLFVFFSVALLFQYLQGAYRSELGGHADEAAHFVTGLFVRDAFVFGGKVLTGHAQGGVIAAARQFGEDYYSHYPKIGLGVWPPTFYLVQSAWTLLLPATPASVLWLMAFLTAALALVLFRVLYSAVGRSGAWAGGFLLLSLPLIQQYSAMVMAEIGSALWMFSAVVQFSRYLETKRPRHMIGFGVLASLAILTKGTGLALALVPPLAILCTGQFGVLKKKALWIGGALTAVLAGPWTVFFAGKGAEVGGWEEHGSILAYAREAAPFFGLKLVVSVGVIVAAFALVGILLHRHVERQESKMPIVLLCFLAAVLIFQSLVPASQEERHLVPLMPAVVYLAVVGVTGVVGLLARERRGLQGFSAFALLIAYLAIGLTTPAPSTPFFSVGRTLRASSFRVTDKGCGGFSQIAGLLVAESAPGAQFLVSSDALGEGMFISEVAWRDHRPSHVAQRASKLLAESKWIGSDYHARFDTPEALAQFLLQSQIAYVVVDRTMPADKKRPHHDLILSAAESDPAHFEPHGTYPIRRGGVVQPEPARVYRIRRDEPAKPAQG